MMALGLVGLEALVVWTRTGGRLPCLPLAVGKGRGRMVAGGEEAPPSVPLGGVWQRRRDRGVIGG